MTERNVELHVYDISKGEFLINIFHKPPSTNPTSRYGQTGMLSIAVSSLHLTLQLSMGFMGIHIEAIYHTSIVVDNVEWYYGAGIQTSYPGTTHHGTPVEVITLGPTYLPNEVIHEYIDSMRPEYMPETYDLFLHNCNHFTADLAEFLCGVAIPEKIKNLPQEVLATPFGQMLRPMLEQQLTAITTGPY